jgi:transcriptional regulator with XRE-family HTH domain
LTITDDPAEPGYEQRAAGRPGFDLGALGERLRQARTDKRWTRGDVERLSAGRWTAAVLGTYERAERSLTAVTLHLLADFYEIPIEELIGCDAPQARPAEVLRLIVFDTRRLYVSKDWPWLNQFAVGVQRARSGPSRRYLRLRSRDVPRLAAIQSEPVDRLLADLVEMKIVVERPAR